MTERLGYRTWNCATCDVGGCGGDAQLVEHLKSPEHARAAEDALIARTNSAKAELRTFKAELRTLRRRQAMKNGGA